MSSSPTFHPVHATPVDPSPGSDLERMIEAQPCKKEYFNLEECLATHDRVWARCQVEVRDLKRCATASSSAATGASQ